MKTHLKILSPSGVFVDKDIDLLTVKAGHGYIGIMANHIPFVSVIAISKMSYKVDDKTFHFAIGGGLLICSEKSVFIVTESIISEDNINLELELKQKQKIEALLKDKSQQKNFQKLQLELKEALNRISLKNAVAERVEKE